MAELPQNVKGISDILPPEVAKWQFVEEKARQMLDAFAYRELRTPILEYTPLFLRTVGEATEVVEKQMYTFDDRDGSSVSLRPEGTASAVRAYIARSQWNREPVTRWYYLGPMFRHERAQRGRLRQFHQIGAEVFGLPGPTVDAEMIAMLVALLGELGIAATDLEVAVNSLGEPDERGAYREALRAYFAGHADELDDFSRRRLDTNPLRILDSKDPKVQALAAEAPVLLDTLGPKSRDHFAAVRAHLADLGVAAVLDPRLVRGLDYYTGTIFEIKAKAGDLGAQNTVVGRRPLRQAGFFAGGPRDPGTGLRARPRASAAGHGRPGRELRGRPHALYRRARGKSARLRPASGASLAPGRHPHRDRAPRGRPEGPAQARRRVAGATCPDHR